MKPLISLQLWSVQDACQENFEEVLKANPHLLQKEILNSGDIVYLPPYVKKENEEVKALWN